MPCPELLTSIRDPSNAPLILVIDDERTFSTNLDPMSIMYARNSSEGIRLLNMYRFDEVYLDHDLGGADTIMYVVDWLVEQAFHGDLIDVDQFYVHSMNPIGAENVIRALGRYYNVRRISLPELI